jgi:hypothetical protein
MDRSATPEKPLVVVDRRVVTFPRPKLQIPERITRGHDDRRQRHRSFLKECEDLAWRLAGSDRQTRIAIYNSPIVSYHELTIAAALRPDLIPTINGEWEWIALTLADHDR